MDCIFTKTEDGFFCNNCGVVRRKATRRNCGLKKGLGDTVARITKAVGVKPCSPCQKRRAKLNAATATPAYKSARLIPTAELVVAAKDLAEMLPPEVDAICGIPRSGMVPASVIAAYLHLPLYTLKKGNVTSVGHGRRITPAEPRNIAFVDDTTMLGGTLKRLEGFKGLKCSIYTNPHSKRKPDLWVKDLEPPHLLEWNLFNSGFLEKTAFDFDGVICYDQPARLWKPEAARPRYLPRKSPVTIITARLEADRAATIDWCKRYGVNVESLIMFTGTEAERLEPQAVAKYKAEALAASGKDWFIESSSQQAKEIAEFSGAWVISTQNFKVY